jgi:hypothetical protein
MALKIERRFHDHGQKHQDFALNATASKLPGSEIDGT